MCNEDQRDDGIDKIIYVQYFGVKLNFMKVIFKNIERKKRWNYVN